MHYFLAASAIIWLALLAYVLRLGNKPSKSLRLDQDQARGLRNEAA